MFAYVLRRLWQMLPTMAGVVLLVFFLFNWVGGDPAYLLAGKMGVRVDEPREYRCPSSIDAPGVCPD